MQPKPSRPKAVTIPIKGTTEHQTFNDCPECGRTWETRPPIPGIIHRTIICNECQKK